MSSGDDRRSLQILRRKAPDLSISPNRLLKQALVAVAFLTALVSPVRAQEEWDFAASHKARCSTGTMLDMTRCLQDELRSVEKALNSEYQALLKSLEDPEPLRQAQRAWLRFRDLDCAYALSGIEKEGSQYPHARTACLIDLSEKRIRDLKRYSSWDGAGAPNRKP